MKKTRGIILFAVLLCTTVLCAQDNIAVADFEKKINSGAMQLLDVRTSGEFKSGHLKDALHADWLKKDEFADRLKYLDKTKPVLVYCASGVRSDAAAKWMRENGFSSVQNLKGGINAWKMEGKPVDATVTTAQLTMDGFNELKRSQAVTLVEFGAEWCPPCRQMQPVLKKLQSDLAGKFKLAQINADNATDVMKDQKIDLIPAFIIYKNGKEVWRKQGVAGLEELKKKLL